MLQTATSSTRRTFARGKAASMTPLSSLCLRLRKDMRLPCPCMPTPPGHAWVLGQKRASKCMQNDLGWPAGPKDRAGANFNLRTSSPDAHCSAQVHPSGLARAHASSTSLQHSGFTRLHHEPGGKPRSVQRPRAGGATFWGCALCSVCALQPEPSGAVQWAEKALKPRLATLGMT